jgi:hypothetical protein
MTLATAGETPFFERINMSINRALLLSLPIFLTAIIPSISLADTIIEGYITEPQIWTAENSPYVIEQSARLSTGVPLKIMAGTRVRFADRWGDPFKVKGSTLEILGTETNPVQIDYDGKIIVKGNFDRVKIQHARMVSTDFEITGAGSVVIENSSTDEFVFHNDGLTDVKRSNFRLIYVYRGISTFDSIKAKDITVNRTFNESDPMPQFTLKNSIVPDVGIGGDTRASIEHNSIEHLELRISRLNVGDEPSELSVRKNNLGKVYSLTAWSVSSPTISENNINIDQGRESSASAGLLHDWSPAATISMSGNFWGDAVTQKMNAVGPDGNIEEISDARDYQNREIPGATIDYSGWLQSEVTDAGPRSE